jgi:hypothetical protein
MNTEQLIAHSRARFDHAAAKRILKEKYQAKLNFAHCGGMFRASPDMIMFLSLSGNDTVVIEDLYQNPIQVQADELCRIMKARFQEQMNAWLTDYQQLNNHR